MKLYEATNGYMGDSYVRGLIIAENEERAKELASEMFELEARRDERSIESDKWLNSKTNQPDREIKTHRFNKDYWENISVECLVDDLSEEESLFMGD